MRRLMLIIMIGWMMAAVACQEEAPSPSNPLSANAGPDQQVWVNIPVQLDGSLSRASNQDEFAYTWVFLSKPEGSRATLQDTTSVAPYFTPDQPGFYVVELLISNAYGQSSDHVTISANVPEQTVYFPYLEDSIISYEHNPVIDVDQDGENDFLFTAEYFSFADKRVELQFAAVSTMAHQLPLYDGQSLLYREGELVGEETIHPYGWDIASGLLLTRVDRQGAISWEGAWKGQRKQYLPFRLRKDEQSFYYGWFCLSADEENERLILHSAAYTTIPNREIPAGLLQTVF